jgi:hypothetical protein
VTAEKPKTYSSERKGGIKNEIYAGKNLFLDANHLNFGGV